MYINYKYSVFMFGLHFIQITNNVLLWKQMNSTPENF